MKNVCIFLLLFITPLVWSQVTEQELFREAETRFRNKDYELALDRYDALVSRYPLSQYVPDAQFRKAVCLYRMGRIDESLSLFQRVENRYRSTRFIDYVPFWKGVILYEQKQYPEAVDSLSVFIDSGKDTELMRQARLYKGLSLVYSRKEDAAVDTLELLLQDAESKEAEAYALSLLFTLYGKSRAYEKILSMSADIDAERIDPVFRDRILFFTAEALWAKSRYDEAEPLFRSLTAAEAEIASTAFSRLFQTVQQSGNDEDLTELLNKAEQSLAGKTKYLKKFWLQVGIISYSWQRYGLSELYFSRIWNMRGVEEISGSVPLYYSRLLQARGERERAIAVLAEYLSAGNEYRDRILLSLAGMYSDTGEFRKALEYLEQFALNHHDSSLYSRGIYQYAYALNQTGDAEETVRVIEALEREGLSGGLTAEFLRLKASAYRKLEEYGRAAEALHEYLSLRPKDVEAFSEYIKMLFVREEYSAVIEEITNLDGLAPDLEKEYPQVYLESRYLLGLSLITQKEYRRAADPLSTLTEKIEKMMEADTVSNDLQTIYPYALFYRGWSLYSLSLYDQALNVFERFVDRYPEHQMTRSALYLAGWNAFIDNSLSRAENMLRKLSGKEISPELLEKTRYLLGKTLIGRGKYREALTEFEYVKTKGGTDMVPQAIFEYAGVLLRMDRLQESADEYLALFERFPDSPLSENGLYQRGEIYYSAGRYEEAREAFAEYRARFPLGNLFDDALFWGGSAAYTIDKKAGAVLLWEILINEYRDSAYRPEAMNRSAEYYADRGDYRKAMNLYTELIALYPEEAEAIRAEEKAGVLRYLVLGLNEREAELWVTIDNEGGANTGKGRQAVIELARLYILEDQEQTLSTSLLVEKVKAVAAKTEEDPAAASQAEYLLGEHFAENGDHARAANTFINAASINPEDHDLVALSLYRGIETLKRIGKNDDAAKLLKRLKENLPDSQWTSQAERLLEGN